MSVCVESIDECTIESALIVLRTAFEHVCAQARWASSADFLQQGDYRGHWKMFSWQEWYCTAGARICTTVNTCV